MPRVRRYRVKATLALQLLLLLAAARPTRAQQPSVVTETVQLESEEARASYQRLVEDGLAAYAAKQFTAARALFAKAHAMFASARTFRALGLNDFALDHYTLAFAELEAALAHPTSPLTTEQRSEVDQLLAWMRANLATVRLELTFADAHAEIDGQPATPGQLLFEPGEHHIEVSAPGYEPQRAQFGLELARPGPALNISLVKSELPAPASASAQIVSTRATSVPESSDTWLWLGGGGVLALASGATLFGLGLHENASVEAPGPPTQSRQEIEQQQSRGVWLTGFGIGLGALGVAGIAGSLVLLTQRRADPNPSRAWHVRVGVAQVQLGTAF